MAGPNTAASASALAARSSMSDIARLAQVLEDMRADKRRTFLNKLDVKEYRPSNYPSFLAYVSAVKAAAAPQNLNDTELIQCIRHRLVGEDAQLADSYFESHPAPQSINLSQFINDMNMMISGSSSVIFWQNCRLRQADVQFCDFKTYAANKFATAYQRFKDRTLALEEVALNALDQISPRLFNMVINQTITTLPEMLSHGMALTSQIPGIKNISYDSEVQEAIFKSPPYHGFQKNNSPYFNSKVRDFRDLSYEPNYNHFGTAPNRPTLEAAPSQLVSEYPSKPKSLHPTFQSPPDLTERPPESEESLIDTGFNTAESDIHSDEESICLELDKYISQVRSQESILSAPAEIIDNTNVPFTGIIQASPSSADCPNSSGLISKSSESESESESESNTSSVESDNSEFSFIGILPAEDKPRSPGDGASFSSSDISSESNTDFSSELISYSNGSSTRMCVKQGEHKDQFQQYIINHARPPPIKENPIVVFNTESQGTFNEENLKKIQPKVEDVMIDGVNFKIGTELTTIEREKLVSLLSASRQTEYSINKEPIGVTSVLECTVETGNSPPSTNQALVFLNKQNQMSDRNLRWCVKLQKFDFEIEYKKGTENKVPDALSRYHKDMRPEDYTTVQNEDQFNQITYSDFQGCLMIQSNEELPVREVLSLNSSTPPIDISPAENMLHCNPDWFIQQQSTDPIAKDYKDLLFSFNSNINLSITKKRQIIDHFIIEDDILYRTKYNQDGRLLKLLFVPKNLVHRVMHAYHNGITCHPNMNNTYKLIAQKYFWPQMNRNIKEYVQSCKICQSANLAIPEKHLLTTTEANYPFEVVSIDFAGPYNGKFILVLIDHFTCFVIAELTDSASADTVIQFLLEKVYFIFGFPNKIISDNGPAFIAQKYKDFNAEQGVYVAHVLAYRPEANAKAERVIKTLKQGITRVMTESHGTPLYRAVPNVVFAYNTTPHSAHGYSPYYLVFARNPRFPIDLSLDFANYKFHTTYNKYVYNMELTYRIANDTAMYNNQISRDQYREYYNKKQPVIRPFKLNERVYYRESLPVGPFEPYYKGIYYVSQIYSPCIYGITKVSTELNLKETKVHISRLKRVRNQTPEILTSIPENLALMAKPKANNAAIGAELMEKLTQNVLKKLAKLKVSTKKTTKPKTKPECPSKKKKVRKPVKPRIIRSRKKAPVRKAPSKTSIILENTEYLKEQIQLILTYHRAQTKNQFPVAQKPVETPKLDYNPPMIDLLNNQSLVHTSSSLMNSSSNFGNIAQTQSLIVSQTPITTYPNTTIQTRIPTISSSYVSQSTSRSNPTYHYSSANKTSSIPIASSYSSTTNTIPKPLNSVQIFNNPPRQSVSKVVNSIPLPHNLSQALQREVDEAAFSKVPKKSYAIVRGENKLTTEVVELVEYDVSLQRFITKSLNINKIRFHHETQLKRVAGHLYIANKSCTKFGYLNLKKGDYYDILYLTELREFYGRAMANFSWTGIISPYSVTPVIHNFYDTNCIEPVQRDDNNPTPVDTDVDL